MRSRTNQAGFSAVELILIFVVVGILAFVGFSVYNRHNKADTAQSTNTSQQHNTSETAQADDVATAPGVNSTSDLDKAAATLDQTDPGGSNDADASQLDTQVSDF